MSFTRRIGLGGRLAQQRLRAGQRPEVDEAVEIDDVFDEAMIDQPSVLAFQPRDQRVLQRKAELFMHAVLRFSLIFASQRLRGA